jgi:hypothetical protein
MTGSRAKTYLGAAALIALIGPAFGQWTSDKPPVLKPSDYPPLATEDPPDPAPAAHKSAHKPDTQGDADSTGPDTAGDQPPVQDAVGPRIRQPAPVEVSNLGTPEGAPVGVADAGFGERLWAGSDRAVVEGLLAKAPIVSPDPVLRSLNRRLALAKAAPPPGQAKRAFLSVRIERLLAAGLIAEAGALAAQAEVPNDEDFAKVQARAILLANRGADACGKATETRNTSADVFWLQLRTACAVMSGDTATADLTREILKAQGHTDKAFDQLLGNIASKKPVSPATMADANAVHLFLMQQQGLAVTEAIARKLGTAANVLAVRDTRNSPRARFEAAERVVMTGAISASDLRVLAEAQDLPMGRVAGAADEAPGLPYYMGQVLLRRAASIETKPEEKARLIALALSLGEKAGALPLTAILQGDVIASIKPGPATRQYGRRFAQALVLSRRFEAASAWANGDPVMRAVIALASQDANRLAAAQSDFAAFSTALAAPPGSDPDRSYKALILGLCDVLGVNMPAEAKAAAAAMHGEMWDGKRPSEADKRAVDEAVNGEARRGEAVLLLTSQIRTLGLGQMAPDATIAYVRDLTALNETSAARALAVEALAVFAVP